MNDRIVGYTIIVALALAIAGLFALFVQNALFPCQKQVIAFDQVGNLAVEDPVCVRGVTVGTVRRIHSVGTRTFVTADLERPVRIYRNCRVITADKGLMGDRIVSIEPGDSTYPIVKAGDTLLGEFRLGVSEALGMVYQLQSTVSVCLDISANLAHGSANKPSLIVQVRDVVRTVDTLSTRLCRLATGASADLASQLSSLENLSAEAHRDVRSIARATPQMIQNIETQVNSLHSFATQLDTLSAQLNAASKRLQDKDNILWGDLAKDLTVNLENLRKITDVVEYEATRLKLVLSLLKEPKR